MLEAEKALPGIARSYWISSLKEPPVYPSVEDNMKVDVAVVGAGITGITTGYLLKAAGYRVAVIDADRILHGTTGQTSAKVTLAHSLKYGRLIRDFGEDAAAQYAHANLAAIGLVAEIVAERGIDCDLERVPSIVYTRQSRRVSDLEAEASALRRLGIIATFSEEAHEPFQAVGASRVDEQLRLHPLKYLSALAAAIPGDGSHVFENSAALTIEDGRPCRVITRLGDLEADRVIVATNYPVYDPALYFMRLYQSRAYIMAMKLRQAAPDVMAYNIDAPTFSYRMHPMSPKSAIAIVSGVDNKTGHGGSTAGRYHALERWGRDLLQPGAIDYHWSTQDTYSLDGVPIIGPIMPGSTCVYVATGYGGWGLSNGTAAAIMLRDLVAGEKNPWLSIFSPFHRVTRTGAGTFLKNGADVGWQYLKGFVPGPVLQRVDGMRPGTARVFKGLRKRAGVYKDKEGEVHAVSAVCTHLKCTVTWNDAELTWDCPCHGSRFNHEGAVLHGPAMQPLPGVDLKEE